MRKFITALGAASGLALAGLLAALPASAAPAAAPAITAIHPDHGSPLGGNTVDITGTFAPAADAGLVTAVTFGGVPAAGITESATEVTAVAPAHAAGDVTVTVTQSGDTTTPADIGSSNAGSYDYTVKTGAIRSLAYYKRVVDDRHSRTVNFNPVQLYPSNGTGAQHWSISAAVWTSGGAISSALNAGKCLDVFHGGTAGRPAGTTVDLFTCNFTAAQVWVYSPATHRLYNPNSGLVLDAETGAVAQLVIEPAGTFGDTWLLP